MKQDNYSVFKISHLMTLNKTDLELTSISVINTCNFLCTEKLSIMLKRTKIHKVSAEL